MEYFTGMASGLVLLLGGLFALGRITGRRRAA